MVFLLVLDIGRHALLVPRAAGQGAVGFPPALEQREFLAVFAQEVVGAEFEVVHEAGQGEGGRQLYEEMEVVRHPSNAVEDAALGLDDAPDVVV